VALILAVRYAGGSVIADSWSEYNGYYLGYGRLEAIYEPSLTQVDSLEFVATLYTGSVGTLYTGGSPGSHFVIEDVGPVV
jgi:hypothetical protein